jgi:transposase
MSPPGVPASTEVLLIVIAARQAQIISLLVKVAELERRLGLNSSNSGKPASGDRLKTRTLHEVRMSGQQARRPKRPPWRSAASIAAPDPIIGRYPASCTGCGAVFTSAMSCS